MLILMAGLPGTGKSTLSRALAAKLGGTVIDKDQVRAALFSLPDIEYSTEQDDFCMAVMLKVAGLFISQRSGTACISGWPNLLANLSIETRHRLCRSHQPAVADSGVYLQRIHGAQAINQQS